MDMKKILVLSVLAALSGFMLAGCQGEEAPKEGSAAVSEDLATPEAQAEVDKVAADKAATMGMDPNNPGGRGSR